MEEAMETMVGKMVPLLDERQRRVFLGLVSEVLGHGGVKELHELTGAGASVISRGRREAAALPEDPTARPAASTLGRVRAAGGGRQGVEEKQPGITEALLSMLDGSVVGNPENPLCWTRVNDHDFRSQAEGLAVPYGVYDIGRDEGYVSVEVSAETGEFAVNAIRSWWETMGRERYPQATRLMVTCDGGGSNGGRNRLWKRSLQALADETGLSIMVCHFPPGTSKWKKIEHRLFSFISRNWRGRPLVSYEVIVSLIAGTTNSGGLSVGCAMDTREYPRGVKVTDDEMAALALERGGWRGDWNYVISPLPHLEVLETA